MEVPNFNGMFPQIIQISMVCSLIIQSSYGGTPIYGNPHGFEGRDHAPDPTFGRMRARTPWG